MLMVVLKMYPRSLAFQNTPFLISTEIEDGRIRLEVPVPGRISYDLNWNRGPRITGYWIERKNGIDVPAGEGPFVIGVPAHPAGAIYGQVLEANGTVATNVYLEVEMVKRPSVMKWPFLDAILGSDENELGKFNASPLPLGGEYAIIARRDSTIAVSKSIKLDKTTPIRQIEFKFVEGVTVSGTLTGPDGRPLANATVSLSGSVEFRGGSAWSSGGRTTTSGDGRFVFEQVNPKIPGSYTLRVNPGPGHQNVRMKIKPRNRPVNIKIRRGYGLSGVVLDDATGWPIPGARVSVYALKKSDVANEMDVIADRDGKFHFSGMDKRRYRLRVQQADIVNRKGTDTVTGGQTEQVTLRVKLASHNKVKPRKPQAKRQPTEATKGPTK